MKLNQLNEGASADKAKNVLAAFKDPENTKLRKKLTLYRKNDDGYAMFRTKMTNLIQSIATDVAKSGKMSSKNQKEFDKWTSTPDSYSNDLKAWYDDLLKRVNSK